MNIVKLTSNNILRLDAVEITPNGNTVVIGGKNGQGKTSVLDSITLALGGRRADHTVPLKKGTDKGKIVCDLGDLLVTRTFTKAGGGTLTVATKDGAKYPSPQAMLDKLTGQLTFDPLSWCHMDTIKQLNTLKGMVGLDFTKQDQERKELFDERTIVNREGKGLKAQYEGMDEFPDAPNEEVLISDLMSELENRQSTNRSNESTRNVLIGIGVEVDNEENAIGRIKVDIAALKKSLKSSEEEHKRLIETRSAQQKKVESLVDANEQEIKDQIENAENINTKVRANINRAKLNKTLEVKRTESQTLSDKITAINKEKADALAGAEFPVDGMSFDETGVLYNGIPFSQASSAEQLRVSVAMGIAMNPELKVLLIRDGSLLDEENLKMVAEMAEKADAQIWIERVGKGEECQVIIEDGKVEGGK